MIRTVLFAFIKVIFNKYECKMLRYLNYTMKMHTLLNVQDLIYYRLHVNV